MSQQDLLSPMEFELAPKEVEVKVGGEKYVLREALGAAGTSYRNYQLKCTVFGEDGKPQSVSGMASADPLLVSECLFKVLPDGRTVKSHVSLELVQSWPDRIQRALSDRVKLLSGINEADETEEELEKKIAELQEKLAKVKKDGEPAKNEPRDTEDGSD